MMSNFGLYLRSFVHYVKRFWFQFIFFFFFSSQSSCLALAVSFQPSFVGFCSNDNLILWVFLSLCNFILVCLVYLVLPALSLLLVGSALGGRRSRHLTRPVCLMSLNVTFCDLFPFWKQTS